MGVFFPMARWVARGGMVIGLLVAVTGCSGGYRGPKACDVFDAATAKSLVGKGAYLKRNNYAPNPEETECEWQGQNGAVSIWVGDWDTVENGFRNEKPVANLGDEAWADVSETYVRKGNIGLAVLAMITYPVPIDLPVENLKVAKLLVSHF